MSIETELRTLLLGDQAIENLVEDRIRPDELDPKDNPPAIRYENLSQGRHGSITGPTGLKRDRLQFDCYGDTRIDANALADLVEGKLDGFRGTVNTLFINDCELENGFDARDRPKPGSAALRYRRTLDFIVTYNTI